MKLIFGYVRKIRFSFPQKKSWIDSINFYLLSGSKHTTVSKFWEKVSIIIWYWRFFNCGLGILPKMITISKTSDAELFKASKIIEIHFETAKLQRFENQYTMKCLKFGSLLWHCKDDWIFAVPPDVWPTFRRGSSGSTHIKPISKWKSVSWILPSKIWVVECPHVVLKV